MVTALGSVARELNLGSRTPVEVTSGAAQPAASTTASPVASATHKWSVGTALWDDDVPLHRIHLDAFTLEPRDAALEGLLLGLELQDHPAVVGLDVCPPDVGDDVEVLHQVVDDGLLDPLGRKGQPHPHPRPRGCLSPRDGGDNGHLIAFL